MRAGQTYDAPQVALRLGRLETAPASAAAENPGWGRSQSSAGERRPGVGERLRHPLNGGLFSPTKRTTGV